MWWPTHASYMQIASFSRRVRLLMLTLCLGLSGCTSLPPVASRSSGMEAELAAHVRFLTQPELKGRKARSAGARLARRYIEDRFQACGLLPWGKAKGYELSFGLGKNVVGLLPGSDTNFAGEIVLLSAHYDHLGKESQGRIYPGAADNASGVAALLEAVRQLSGAQPRPKRTIAFVAFDAEEEMMLGSFAFCGRPDVEQAKIVAVINVDMLGRDFLDVVQNTLLVAGTEGHPTLQAQVRGFGTEAGIRILPLGSELIGPRSDHVAFETRDMLCLFFTCGTFTGYHQPSDTAEKLNYTNLQRSAKVILRTVETLANADQNQPTDPAGCDREELQSLHTVVAELCRSPEKAGIKPQDMEALGHLNTSIETLLDAGTYDRTAREQILLELTSSLMCFTMGVKPQSLFAVMYSMSEHVYLNYHREWLEGQKQMVAAVLKHPPSLFHALSPFEHELYELRDDDLSLVQTGTNTFALHAFVNGFHWSIRNQTLIWPFQAPRFDLGPTSWPFDCEGSREQLTDYCLLWQPRFRTNALHVEVMKKVLRAVSGAEPQGGYHEWLQARLAQGGYSGETEWLLSCMQSSSPELAGEAIGAASNSQDPRVRDAACEILVNRNAQADLRSCAMLSVVQRPNRAALLALTEVLDDPRPVYLREFCPQFHPDYPLANRTAFLAMRPAMDRWIAKGKKTIGQEALENLKRLTKKDFGADMPAWKKWVRSSG